MKAVACMYTSATEDFQGSDWKNSDVVNGYDCGLFAVVNAYAIIINSQLAPVNSLKARMWIHSLNGMKDMSLRRSGILTLQDTQIVSQEKLQSVRTIYCCENQYPLQN